MDVMTRGRRGERVWLQHELAFGHAYVCTHLWRWCTCRGGVHVEVVEVEVEEEAVEVVEVVEVVEGGGAFSHMFTRRMEVDVVEAVEEVEVVDAWRWWTCGGGGRVVVARACAA